MTRRTLALLLTVLLGACAAVPDMDGSERNVPARGARTMDPVLGRDDQLLVVVALAGDTAATLAQRYLGDAAKAWWIYELNAGEEIVAGRDVLVPLRAPRTSHRAVPILCYHRFGPKAGKLTVTPAAFAAQMEYLADNGYKVITLRQLSAFLQGHAELPPKSVALTIDDGYRSTYQLAYPVLRQRGFPATVFLYTDFVGAPDAMTWEQMREMTRSGLIEIQPHSRSHPNLALRAVDESDARYRSRVRLEVEGSKRVIASRLDAAVYSFAYPYGVVNDEITDQLQAAEIELGLTVTPGGNGFFADPRMLRRTMVFGDENLSQFKSKLQVFVIGQQR
jgi:peptidoglycan/xylan/chitin deacetylase (PgdA/CDA1 family)